MFERSLRGAQRIAKEVVYEDRDLHRLTVVLVSSSSSSCSESSRLRLMYPLFIRRSKSMAYNNSSSVLQNKSGEVR